MTEYYFYFKGIRYNEGDYVKLKFYNHEVRFICCKKNTEKPIYTVSRSVAPADRYTCNTTSYSEKIFFENLEYARKTEPTKPTKEQLERAERVVEKYLNGPTFKEEMSINGLGLAWIWYIFIMMIGTIFNARFLIWIVASLVFFNYRSQKLKEAGWK